MDANMNTNVNTNMDANMNTNVNTNTNTNVDVNLTHNALENSTKCLSKAEMFYMELEFRKILQIHHMFPTTFVFPMNGYTHNGISGIQATKFKLMKSDMMETWKIQIKSGPVEDTGCETMADALLKYFGKRH